eukprot:CAMPEP_0170351624 /NCGR_PEP_ID=MMETSP0116_2-20130129/77118_1 /TAXON_ID=400756 /ORGANISM="Durinskia baltica, Strain CSIRO CS-38" /LENGTH=107 /DNA_ID=CAMNT_0010605539 /DNA_START=210 /DNA_END=530 /DNA_ORIENTATION=+
MPAVSVLPLRSTVGSSHHTTDTRLLEVIVDGMPEVHPVTHMPDGRENSAKKSSGGDEVNTKRRAQKSSGGDLGGQKTKSSDQQDTAGKPSNVERKESNATGGTVSPS